MPKLNRTSQQKISQIFASQLSNILYISGPRQAGKTTLVKDFAKKFSAKNNKVSGKISYITFDDHNSLLSAKADPEEFVKNLEGLVIIDEVQLVPEIFRPIKKRIDEARYQKKKINFLLTGSANVMLMPQLSDALVGRMNIVNLLPISVGEAFKTHGNFIKFVFEKKISFKKNAFLAQGEKQKKKSQQAIKKATFPQISANPKIDREAWFRDYINTLLKRDVREIVEIENLTALPKILKCLGARVGGLINDADVARDAALNQMTLKRYKILLENVFLTFQVKPWFRNLSKRLIKTPKIYFTDTLLLSHVLGLSLDELQKNNPEIFGQVLENFVASELLKQTKIFGGGELYHFRTSDNKEVDFVIERPDGKLVGIEVKSKKTLQKSDLTGLETLQGLVPKSFVKGIILYQGTDILTFGNNIFALPIAALWECKS